MKNILLLLGILIASVQVTSAQTCANNIVINGDLELGTPFQAHNDIDNATGFSRIWATGSFADFHFSNTVQSQFNLPMPQTGQYASCWISNRRSLGATYREGFTAKLLHTLPPNTGTYTLNIDVACLGGWGNAELAVYGIHNPNDNYAPTPTGAFTPVNNALFGTANTILLQTSSFSIDNCSPNKGTMNITINTNSTNYPAGGMTHIMITSTDNSYVTSLYNNETDGAIYVAFDNFCLAVANDCPGSFVINGDLESGSTLNNDINNATNFSDIWANGNSADYYTSNTAASNFLPPSPADGNYASCWMGNNTSGGTIYRQGFKSEFIAPILSNTGYYTLDFDLACLGGWGNAEVAVYGVYNPNNLVHNTPTGAYTPSNINLFGPLATTLLGTIPVGNNCSSTKTHQSITFNSQSNNFPAGSITHFYVTHSDNQAINGNRYVAFDNFCLQSADPPCPNILSYEVLCGEDLDDNGIPIPIISFVMEGEGTMNISSPCGRVYGSSITINTPGNYSRPIDNDNNCEPFTLNYDITNTNGQPCSQGDLSFDFPDCAALVCTCDKIEEDVSYGFSFHFDCDADYFVPNQLSSCDEVEWFVNGNSVGRTVGREALILPHIDNPHNLCMQVTRTDIDGNTCDATYCQDIQSHVQCRTAQFGVNPNPVTDKVILNWSTEDIPSHLSISIFNASGIEIQRVNKVNGHEGYLEFDAKLLESGFYFIQIEGLDYVLSPIKFIKK